MSAPVAFLTGKKSRPLSLSAAGFTAHGYHLGPGEFGLEVVVVSAATADPRQPAIRGVWKDRHAGRAAPVLLVVLRPDGRAQVCGPLGLKDDAPVSAPLDLPLVEFICREALALPNKEVALRYLRDALPAIQSDTPGVRNEGFLAGYTIRVVAQ